jgi:hypothetical protein
MLAEVDEQPQVESGSVGLVFINDLSHVLALFVLFVLVSLTDAQGFQRLVF